MSVWRVPPPVLWSRSWSDGSLFVPWGSSSSDGGEDPFAGVSGASSWHITIIIIQQQRIWKIAKGGKG